MTAGRRYDGRVLADRIARALEAPLVGREALRPLDAIVVLGAPLGPGDSLGDVLAERAAAAVALWRAGGAPLVIASGGITHGARRAEAEVLADAIRAAGVPEVLVERASRTTAENARFTAALLAARDDVARDDASRGHAARDHAARDHTTRDHAARGHAARDHAARDHAARGDAAGTAAAPSTAGRAPSPHRAAHARSVWLVTQPFHARRAVHLFRRAGLDAHAWHIADSIEYRDRVRALRWLAREYAAWAALLVREATRRA